ncbi:MAG: PfkB family carbohydrate kinase [Verrucomicrobiota bacterium]
MAGEPVKAKFDILGLGAVAVDDLIYVTGYPPADTKTHVLRTERQCGGLTAIALIAATRLGSKCAYAGVLGEDEFSQFAIAQMQNEGVDLKHLQRRQDARPVHSFIVVDSQTGTRNIFCDLSGVVGAGKDWPKESVIRAARVLFVDHIGLAGMIRAAKIARQSGIPVVADLERESGPTFPTLLGLVDHLIVSQGFAKKLTRQGNPARAAKALWTEQRKVVVVTCGEKGCWYLHDNETKAKHLPAFKVSAVDTTGCGDVFHGAYAAGLAEKKTVEECVRFASAAAALKATNSGAQNGIPTRGLVEKFLADRSE